MTDAISQYGRLAQSDTTVRNALEKLDKKAATADGKAPAPAEQQAPRVAPRPGPDTLSLSNVAQKAMNEPEFDRVKVESIKKAIQDGQYPLDAKRIAESFVAIEKMIGD
jgi:negative regulator of flagellin synthesis FlgM